MVFFNTFIAPIVFIIIILMLPISITRLYMYVSKLHFINKSFARNISFWVHAVSWIILLIITLIFRNQIIEVNFMYGMLLITLLIILVAYRHAYVKQRRNQFIVAFNKGNNKETWKHFCKDNTISNVNIDGSFSFVSELYFENYSDLEAKNTLTVFENNPDILIRFESKAALFKLGGYVFLFGSSLVSYLYLLAIL